MKILSLIVSKKLLSEQAHGKERKRKEKKENSKVEKLKSSATGKRKTAKADLPEVVSLQPSSTVLMY